MVAVLDGKYGGQFGQVWNRTACRCRVLLESGVLTGHLQPQRVVPLDAYLAARAEAEQALFGGRPPPWAEPPLQCQHLGMRPCQETPEQPDCVRRWNKALGWVRSTPDALRRRCAQRTMVCAMSAVDTALAPGLSGACQPAVVRVVLGRCEGPAVCPGP